MKKFIVIIIVIVIAIAFAFVINMKNQKDINYEIAEVNEYNYFKYLDNEKIGIIDKLGKVIIEAKYDEIIIPNPQKDIFVCYNGEKCRILNSSNSELFTQYDEVEPIQLKNIASVLSCERSVLKYKKGGLYGLIDFDGKEITKNIYNKLENLQSTEGKFLVEKDGKFGIINLNGSVLVKTSYDVVKTDGYYDKKSGYIYSGFITGNKTEDGYRYGYISYDGKIILKEEYNSLTRVPNMEKIYLIISKDGRYGLYQESKKVINTEYQSISYMDNGGIIIQKNKNYGIASLEGKILVDTKYEKIESKGIYLYAENKDEKEVYDINGNKIDINFNKFIYETNNENYRIILLTNNEKNYYGIESKTGKELVVPTYNYIEYVFKDYFVAKDESGKLGVINSNGKKIIEFKYDTLQKIKRKNILQAVAAGTNTTEIYSSNLEVICKVENATIYNENGYIEILNDKEVIYVDEEGKIIDADTEEFKKLISKNFPDKVGEYIRIQLSIDNIYYEKE